MRQRRQLPPVSEHVDPIVEAAAVHLVAQAEPHKARFRRESMPRPEPVSEKKRPPTDEEWQRLSVMEMVAALEMFGPSISLDGDD